MFGRPSRKQLEVEGLQHLQSITESLSQLAEVQTSILRIEAKINAIYDVYKELNQPQ